MNLGRYIKSPIERKRYTIDYNNWLDTGELITGRTFSVTPAGQLSINGDGIGTDSRSLYFFVNGGLDSTEYVVDVQITTAGGQVKEDTVKFLVKNQP